VKRRHAATPGSFAERLQKLRDKRGISQAKAAELADISARTWICWENEQRTPSKLAIAGLRQIFPDLK
jgi:transcriptional regulator with XRE-family HTH domain